MSVKNAQNLNMWLKMVKWKNMGDVFKSRVNCLNGYRKQFHSKASNMANSDHQQ